MWWRHKSQNIGFTAALCRKLPPSRRHTEAISQVCDEALTRAGLSYDEIDALAVTYAPGLIGALLVGVNFAKGLALSTGKPLIPVHHLRAHIAANYITHPTLEPPFLCLLVSGGNTVLTEVNDYTSFRVIGGTRDDAAGECFDKAARCMGLSYPGGVTLDKIASVADDKAYPLPFPHVSTGEFDFSFSGLKTAVMNLLNQSAMKGEQPDIPVLCATLRKRVCDILIDKTMRAAEQYGHRRIAVAGGVSANSELRRRLDEECQKRNRELFYPELCYCGDNAAMVGVQGFYEYTAGKRAELSLNAFATRTVQEG